MVTKKKKVSLAPALSAPATKKPRVVFDVQHWDSAPSLGFRAEVVGDNENTVGWMNGRRRCTEARHTAAVGVIKPTAAF